MMGFGWILYDNKTGHGAQIARCGAQQLGNDGPTILCCLGAAQLLQSCLVFRYIWYCSQIEAGTDSIQGALSNCHKLHAV